MDANGNPIHQFTGTSFDAVWNHYLFDRKLRLLFMDAIERIEVALRSRLVDYYTRSHSPFDYLNNQHAAKRMAELERQAGIVNGQCDFAHCKYACVHHFFSKYGDKRDHLPFWIVAEIMEFGFMAVFYQRMPHSTRMQLAAAALLRNHAPLPLPWEGARAALRRSAERGKRG